MTSTPSASPNVSKTFSKIPQFTVKEVSEKMKISIYALRYYDKLHLFPFLQRDENGTRLFSEFDLEWVRIVHCLRSTGLPIAEVKHYIELCLKGDQTIDERADIIFQQEENTRKNIRDLQEQLKILQTKKAYYQALQENRNLYDAWNPANQ